MQPSHTPSETAFCRRRRGFFRIDAHVVVPPHAARSQQQILPRTPPDRFRGDPTLGAPSRVRGIHVAVHEGDEAPGPARRRGMARETPPPEQTRREALAVLRHNPGFSVPERWVDYALTHGFRRVEATPVPRCPDCGSDPERTVGQYVHRSSLVRLRECDACDLMWTDVRIQEGEEDSLESGSDERPQRECPVDRSPVYRHLAGFVTGVAGRRASVLEIGGGKGHLLSQVRDRRPDLSLVLQDASAPACRYAESHFGLATLCGDLTVLETLSRPFDVVILDEVLDYVPDLGRMWRLLRKLVAKGGSLVVRLDGRRSLVRIGAALGRIAGHFVQPARQDRLPFLDPDQLYVMTPAYLEGRLRALGFGDIEVKPAPFPLDHSGVGRHVRRAGFGAARLLNRVTFGTWSPTPAVVLTAVRSTETADAEDC